jgi:Ger(x)C family germination protein
MFPVLALLLTGCWDTKDLNKRVLPVAMGISEGESETFKVGLRIPEPRGGQMKIRHIEAEAPTVSRAIDRMQMNMQNNIDLLHLELILISENLAKKSVREVLEYSMQSREIPSKAIIAIVRSDMRELLNAQGEGGEEGGEGFYDFFSKEAGWTPHYSRVPLWAGFRSMISYTEDISLPILSKGTETMFKVKGSALMQQDKMVDTITPEETLLYNIYQHNYDGAHIEIMKHASVRVVDADVTLSSSWNPNAPKVSSRLKVTVTVEETEVGATLTVIQEELKHVLQERFQKLMNKLQSHHSDIMGFGQLFRSSMSPTDIKQWREIIYPRLKLEQSVEVVIRNSGSLKVQ